MTRFFQKPTVWLGLMMGLWLNPAAQAQIPQDAEQCDGEYPRCPHLILSLLQTSRLNPSANPSQLCTQNFEQLPPGSILTSKTLCREGLTPPSLWWTLQQFEAQGDPEYKKLVQNWLTHLPNSDRPGRVDLVLELQRWSTMDYFKRYEFFTVFGSAAQTFGYDVRAFSFRGEFLGSYTCGTAGCDITVEGSGAEVQRSNPF